VHVSGLDEAPDEALLGHRLAGEGFVALQAVPLIAKGQLVGVLEVFQRRAIPEEPDAQLFLEVLAGQAAIAIENAKLFEGLQRSNAKLSLAYDATLLGWAEALDQRNHEAPGHSQRVADLAVRLARVLGFDESKLAHLRRGALLHDVGHLSLPESVLLKPGPLNEAEWAAVRQHPTWAHALLAPVRFLQPALDIPLYHHERWDGTGYPHGLKVAQTPLAARIFAVADVWVALCAARAYRPAREHIRAEASHHFDPAVVAAFLALDPELLTD
jgi:HD-GYP domain-containing protein (c-di-GMP phosphodiesterase class II)